MFQSRTGFPGHSDTGEEYFLTSTEQGFNPERASQAIPTRIYPGIDVCTLYSFNPERASQAIPTWVCLFANKCIVDVSIPNGLPRPFRRRKTCLRRGCRTVSIPNGLPRPFRLIFIVSCRGFLSLFQSRTGFPGHSDCDTYSIA